MLMNDAFVADLALAFANRVLEDESLRGDRERIDRLFQNAFGRPASHREAAQALQFMDDIRRMQAQEHKLEGNASREALAELQEEAEDLREQLRDGAPSAEVLAREWWRFNPSAELATVEREIRNYELQLGEPNPWPALAHSLFSLKEFIFIQ